MASNRTDDDKFWTETRTKGFSFNDEAETDEFQDSSPWLKDLSSTQQMKQELRDEVSFASGLSETSSISDDLQNSATMRELPEFLLLDHSEVDYEPRGDTRTLGFKVPEFEECSVGVIHIKGTIHGLLLGHEVSLERFKSLADKKMLLAKALEINDGNAITAIIIFLQRTLRQSLFQQIIFENKQAANHYIRYLEKKSETETLVNTLNMLGRTNDALVVRYKTILRSEANLGKIETQLRHFYTAECNITDEYIANLVKSHYNLIETHKNLQSKMPSFRTTDAGSVLKTLGILSERFYEETHPPFSPVCFRATHNLNDKQFAWVNLTALTKAQKWPKIESLLLTKSWLGGSKDKCLLPLEDVCNTLKDAPVDLISVFLRLIENPDKKLAIAKRLKCHTVVLETYAAQKCRDDILSYRTTLQENSKEAVYADSLLHNPNIKWKK